MTEQPTPEPRWRVPSPYNYAGAVDGMGTVAAPLLASLCIALVAVVISNTSAFAEANLALLLLLVAAVGFIATLQFSVMARQYIVTPSQLDEWWPDCDAPSRRDRLRSIQRSHLTRFFAWADRARFAYNTGILALSLGVGTLLAPRHWNDVSQGRIVVLIVAALAFLVELAWVVGTLLCPDKPELPPVGPEKPTTT